MLAGAPTASALSRKKCQKCGTVKKSGKVSCCARGGGWFKKCGNAGDTNFDHTWGEGIQACSGFETLLLDKPPVRDRDERIVAQSMNVTDLRNTAHEHVNTGDVSDLDTLHCGLLLYSSMYILDVMIFLLQY